MQMKFFFHIPFCIIIIEFWGYIFFENQQFLIWAYPGFWASCQETLVFGQVMELPLL